MPIHPFFGAFSKLSHTHHVTHQNRHTKNTKPLEKDLGQPNFTSFKKKYKKLPQISIWAFGVSEPFPYMSYMSCVRIHKNSEKCASSGQHTFHILMLACAVSMNIHTRTTHNLLPILMGSHPLPPSRYPVCFGHFVAKCFGQYFTVSIILCFFFSEIR